METGRVSISFCFSNTFIVKRNPLPSRRRHGFLAIVNLTLDLFQFIPKLETVVACLPRFWLVTYYSDPKRVWVANFLHAMQLPKPLGDKTLNWVDQELTKSLFTPLKLGLMKWVRDGLWDISSALDWYFLQLNWRFLRKIKRPAW